MSEKSTCLTLERLPVTLSVCRLPADAPCPGEWLTRPFTFAARTDRELSLVCPTQAVPREVLTREDGWGGFRVAGALDFSLTGILSGIAGVLAEEQIALFAVSTYDTDYILVRSADLDRALAALAARGYAVR